MLANAVDQSSMHRLTLRIREQARSHSFDCVSNQPNNHFHSSTSANISQPWVYWDVRTSHIRLLAQNNVIDPALTEAALASHVTYRDWALAPTMPPSSRLMAMTEERGLPLGRCSGKVEPPFSPGC